MGTNSLCYYGATKGVTTCNKIWVIGTTNYAKHCAKNKVFIFRTIERKRLEYTKTKLLHNTISKVHTQNPNHVMQSTTSFPWNNSMNQWKHHRPLIYNKTTTTFVMWVDASSISNNRTM